MPGASSKRRHSHHQTQWAAQFAVASELCKRGYEVALTMGNHPSVDLMVVSPGGVQFGIDVKGLYSRNFWVVSKKPQRDGLYYVLAFVPEGKPNQYFILTQEEANAAIDADTEIATQRAAAKGRVPAPGFTGMTFVVAEIHKECWGKLPAWGRSCLPTFRLGRDAGLKVQRLSADDERSLEEQL